MTCIDKSYLRFFQKPTVYFNQLIWNNLIKIIIDGKSSQTKTFSQNLFYLFCLYHFSLKCIIKNFYLSSDDPLNTYSSVSHLPMFSDSVYHTVTHYDT